MSSGTDQKAADTQAESHTHAHPEPGSTIPDRNARVREMAYFLWLDEGRPEGGAERHWTTAEALIGSEPEERKRIEGEPPGEEPPVSPVSPRGPRRQAAE
jgi:hypothetical protein